MVEGLKRVTQNANSPHNATEHPLLVKGLNRVTQNAYSPRNATEYPIVVEGVKRVTQMPILHIMPLSTISWWGD